MQSEKKEINIGICLLKIIMCFMVIFQHFFINYPQSISNFCKIACPIFMIVSFLFVSKIFTEHNLEKFKQRLQRLAIPFYMWGLIFSLIFFTANCFVNFNPYIKSDIIYQLLTGHGHGINAPLWYLFDAIIITILFYIIFKIFTRKIATFVIFGIFFISVLIQYSGLNYNLFSNLAWGIKYPLGRLCEMIPYASIGFLLGNNNVLDKLKFNRAYYSAILIFFTTILAIYVFFNGPEKQFGYSGIYCIILSTIFTILFYNLKINNELLKNFITNISKYTLGIYCMHYGIGQIYKILLPAILHTNTENKIYQTGFCICIFATGLLISFTLYKIGNKKKIIRQMVI